MANKEIAENVEAPTWDDFPQMYAQAKADTLLTRLDAAGAEENEAAARIRELEAQLARLASEADELQDEIMVQRIELSDYRSRATSAEARAEEAERERDIALDNARVIGARLVEIGDITEARAAALEKKLADERQHSEWLQGECDKAVDAQEWANGKKAKATQLVAQYKSALEIYANRENWHVCDDGPHDINTCLLIYRDGRDLHGYEIAQAALRGAEEEE